MLRIAIAILTLWTAVSTAATNSDEGRREEARSCAPCHSLRIIHVQRLSKAAWEKELDKMERWGAVIKNRPALLDYLVDNFSESVPPPPPVMSPDGRTRKDAK